MLPRASTTDFPSVPNDRSTVDQGQRLCLGAELGGANRPRRKNRKKGIRKALVRSAIVEDFILPGLPPSVQWGEFEPIHSEFADPERAAGAPGAARVEQ